MRVDPAKVFPGVLFGFKQIPQSRLCHDRVTSQNCVTGVINSDDSCTVFTTDAEFVANTLPWDGGERMFFVIPVAFAIELGLPKECFDA